MGNLADATRFASAPLKLVTCATAKGSSRKSCGGRIIVQLVGRRVKLTRKGRVFWGCCPFHKEKSPSFKVENERRTYKCFGCGAGRRRLQMAGGDGRSDLPGSGREAGGRSGRRASANGRRTTKRAKPSARSLYDISSSPASSSKSNCAHAAARRRATIWPHAGSMTRRSSNSGWAIRPTRTRR